MGIIRRGHQHVIVEVVEEGLLEGWPEIQGWQEVSSQLAFLCAPPLDVPASASSVSPVLVRKAIMIDLPVKNLPENFRSEEHTSELQSLMRISYAVFCLQKKNILT